MIQCLVNGVDTDLVAASDRGLHYGDGLFETVAVVNGNVRNWHLHINRLAKGCQRLGISMPEPGLLLDEARQVAHGKDKAVCKILLTRGSAGRGYRYAADGKITRIVISYDWPDYLESYYKKGVNLHICETRISYQPALAGIKHLNRLENVLARNEWHGNEYAEGLMLDLDGHVVEGTMTNVFWVESGCLLTPLLDKGGVHGVMRHRVISISSELGIPCSEAVADVPRIMAADELFVCNSIIGIWPASIDNRHEKGAITARLMQYLDDKDDT